MSERIDQFCENLRVKLTSIENNMQALKGKIDSKAQTAEQEVRTGSAAFRRSWHCDWDLVRLSGTNALAKSDDFELIDYVETISRTVVWL